MLLIFTKGPNQVTSFKRKMQVKPTDLEINHLFDVISDCLFYKDLW